ncbi:FAD-dependent oxidoreductase [Gordonia desulfuricans]|uniref:FAD-dependent oxidoreductase n=1 Tax=Gordonia desulfuricans TaxID=89051 RepID=A0A7K3LNK3_9ACTN|nr:FAD-dependent oxidoreductase [Gordonia desulfuricans]NDK89768.1 FAD-dependent oxidoreductase [Gordonia desulfuricans]
MTTSFNALRPPSIAVVGSGVAGLTAAHDLCEHARVTLFEADSRLGGHAHTHRIATPDGREVSVDSGFIVHNDRTYPTLLRLFDDLKIPSRETDMSMSVHSEISGLEYAGALGARGLFPTPRNLVRGRYLLMLGEIVRFHRAARRVLDSTGSDEPLDAFVARHRFSTYFLDNFLLPLVAAVWSCDSDTAAGYPARYLFTFLEHHGMLSVFGSPTWRTVEGGSITYVEAVADRVRDHGGRVVLSAPVRRIVDQGAGVEITAGGFGTGHFDAVVVATHPHQALDMLAAPTDAQRRVLGAIDYSAKSAVLHSDTSLLPHSARARAAWNYQIRTDQIRTDAPARTQTGSGVLDGSGVAVTYDLTRLMRLEVRSPRMLVTLGRTDLVDPGTVHAEMTYEHPVYTTRSVAAQACLPTIDSPAVRFAGAYHGWGFHEDGAASGAAAAHRILTDTILPAGSARTVLPAESESSLEMS